MSRTPAAKRQPKPLIPAPRDEDILKAIAQYRFVTAQEVTRLCYSKGSLTYARSRLSALCGNKDITDEDFTEGYPLLRMGFPTGKRGNNEYIFALSLTGRRIVERLGIPVSWHLRPEQLRTFSHSYLLHDLSRNRFVVALLTWAKSKPNLRLESRLSYEIAKQPPTVEIPIQRSILKEGKLVKIPVMTKVGVIPDGEIVVTNTSTGERLLIILELDHNTLGRQRLRNHLVALLAYTKSPHFRERYGNITYRIVYATQGLTDSASRARLKAMCKLTMRLLIDRKREKDSEYFRFTTITFKSLYDDSQSLFEKAVWHKPDDLKLERPVPLFT